MPISLRANLLKTSPDLLYKELIHSGAEVERVSWYDQAFIVHNLEMAQLTDLELYKTGQFYIQNLSSMLPVLALDPHQNEQILDMCTAPGSKATQIASTTQDKAQIVALDVSRDRLFKMHAILEKQGVTSVSTEVLAGQIAWKKYPEQFDRVLVDAPCSMQQEPGPDSKKAKMLAPKQHYLLRSAVSCCKVGGSIVYATCSISKIENESVVDWILDKEADNIEVEFCVRIQPDQISQGFFLAKLRKIKSNL